MNRLPAYLNQLFSGLNLTFSRRVRPFYSLLTGAVFLTTIFFYLQGTPLIQDWEHRFQSNFYIFGSFFNPPDAATSPVVIVLINDQSLPEGVARSPIDRRWLRLIINKVSDQQPAMIGLNVLLDRPQNPVDDQALAAAFAKSGKVIIRSDPYYPPLAQFSKAALDQGVVRFKFDSSGAVQEICHSPRSCRSENIFHLNLLHHLTEVPPGSFSTRTGTQPEWLSIDFSASHTLSKGKKMIRFPVIFANELEQLPQNALRDKTVLIGAGFPDLYPLFRTPLANDEHFLQETEILAHVLDMMVSNRYLKPLSAITSAVLLLVLLSVLSLLLSSRGILPGLWFLAVALPVLFFSTAIAFTMFRLVVPFVLPALLLIFFFGVGMFRQVMQERFARLMTELNLKEAKIDFLTNELHTHHLFNELSRLNVMIGQQPATARAYLVEFAELLRLSLKYGDQPQVPISVQMDYLNTYAQQQHIIHKDKIRITIDVDGDWESVHAPWQLFFPLVENAVKQTEVLLGQAPDHSLTIEILLRKERDRLHFTVRNPFLVQASLPSAGKGLKNLGDRLKWSYPGGGFKLSSFQHDQNWVATLQLPLS